MCKEDEGERDKDEHRDPDIEGSKYKIKEEGEEVERSKYKIKEEGKKWMDSQNIEGQNLRQKMAWMFTRKIDTNKLVYITLLYISCLLYTSDAADE